MNSSCIIGDQLILKQQNQLNKIKSQIKTTFAAYLTSIKPKNHIIQQIKELDVISYGVVRLSCYGHILGIP